MKGALGLLLAFGPTIALSGQAPVPLRLVRCREGSSTSCIEATFRLEPSSARLAGGLDSLTELRSWTGTLAGWPLIGPGVSQAREITPPVRVLLLVDRSHEMAGEALAFTRTALKSFLSQLEPGSARVAVAGFESHAVSVGIRTPEFLPPAAAQRALDSIAPPVGRANRALYSAISTGVTRVAAALKADPGTTGLVIVLTNGPDVVDPRRDDAGLLSGTTGMQAAATTAAAAGVEIRILALGASEGMTALRQVVGANGEVMPLALDPNQITAALSGISRGLRPGRTLTFGLGVGSSAAMARAAWIGAAVLQIAGRPAISLPLRWQPPLFALPGFADIASPGALPPRVRDLAASSSPGVSTRALVALVIALLIAGVWYFVPRLIWIRGADLLGPGLPVFAATPSQRAAAAGRGGHGEELREASPRSPEEITRQTARRSADRR